MSGPILRAGHAVPLAGPAAANRAAGGGPAVDRAKLDKACQDLESFFIYHMLQQMRATVPEGGLLTGGRAEGMYRQMLDGELAKSMAAQKGMGLARMMEESLTAAAVARASGPDRQAPLPVDPVGPQPAKMMDENKRSTANRPKVAPLAGR